MTEPIRDGVVLSWKPPGMGSAALVTILKKKTGLKAGHTGTLDRFAEGLMILLVGRGTAFADYFLKLDKTYEATFRFGRSTDTLDPHGEVLEDWPSDRVEGFLREEGTRIEAAIGDLTQQTSQIPPEYSALKQDGMRLSDRARRGLASELRPRTIRIYQARCLAVIPEEGLVGGFFSVSSGTYIRSIARDLGAALGIPVSVQGLKRLSIGCFDASHPLLWRDPDQSAPEIVDLLTAFSDWPRIEVGADAERLVGNGVQLPVPPELEPGRDCFLVSGRGDLLAWAVSQGERLVYRKVFGGGAEAANAGLK